MGHSRTEMMSEEERIAEAKAYRTHDDQMSLGAQALRDVFGDRAAAVAFFIRNVEAYTDARPLKSFETAMDRYAPVEKPVPPKP